jgi:hypothetical protein
MFSNKSTDTSAPLTVKRTIPRSNVTGGLFVARVVPNPNIAVAPSKHYYDNEFTNDELRKLDLKGTMVTLAHNLAYNQTHVGNVVDSWIDNDGSLYATATLFEAANGVAAVGKIRALNTAAVSLGHATFCDPKTGTDSKHAFELTLCEKPRRDAPVIFAIDHGACDKLFNVGNLENHISRAALDTATQDQIIDSSFNLITLNTRASAWPENTHCVSAKNCETLGWSACDTQTFGNLLMRFSLPTPSTASGSSTFLHSSFVAKTGVDFGTPQNPTETFLLALRKLTSLCVQQKDKENYRAESLTLAALAKPYFSRASLTTTGGDVTGPTIVNTSSGDITAGKIINIYFKHTHTHTHPH